MPSPSESELFVTGSVSVSSAAFFLYHYVNSLWPHADTVTRTSCRAASFCSRLSTEYEIVKVFHLCRKRPSRKPDKLYYADRHRSVSTDSKQLQQLTSLCLVRPNTATGPCRALHTVQELCRPTGLSVPDSDALRHPPAVSRL